MALQNIFLGEACTGFRGKPWLDDDGSLAANGAVPDPGGGLGLGMDPEMAGFGPILAREMAGGMVPPSPRS